METVVELAEVTAPHLLEELGLAGLDLGMEQRFWSFIFTCLFRIERDNLYREDIRDLVELTVGRMDIYHLIGALILEICITFLCENAMIELHAENSAERIPTWCLNMFLLSNFAAVGYLVFAVWLAMHASVAAASVGVRLLTSVQRVTIPDPEEVQQVMIKRLFSQVLDRLKSSRTNVATTREKLLGDPLALVREHPAGWSHFRMFHEHSAHWRSFDEHSRICMFLGINQMLQALSYYIMGPLSVKSPGGAVVSLFGVQILSMCLLRMDVKDVQGRKFKDAFIVFWLLPFPVFLACVLSFLSKEKHYKEFSHKWAVLCFFLHAGWLYMVYLNIPFVSVRLRTATYTAVLSEDMLLTKKEQQEQAGSRTLGPLRNERHELEGLLELKLQRNYEDGPPDNEGFISSLEVVPISDPKLKAQLDVFTSELAERALGIIRPRSDQPLEEAIGDQECRIRLASLVRDGEQTLGVDHEQVALGALALKRAELVDALLELEYQVRMAEKQELVMGSLQPSWRMEAEPIRGAIMELRNAVASLSGSCEEVQIAVKAHSRVQYWRRAPRMFAEFKALVAAVDSGWVPDHAVDYAPAIRCAYQHFLAFCHDMSLGIYIDKDGSRVWSRVAAAQMPWVRVEMPAESRGHGAEPSFCWVLFSNRSSAEPQVKHDATGLDAISAEGFFSNTLPNFLLSEEHVAQEGSGSKRATMVQSLRRQIQDQYKGTMGADGLKLESKACAPDPGLPRRLVRYLTLGAMLIWILTGLAHLSMHMMPTSPTSFSSAEADLHIGDGLTLYTRALAEVLRSGYGDVANIAGWPQTQQTVTRIPTKTLDAEWPAPQVWFEVSALFCTKSHLLIGNRFATFAAERPRADAEAWSLGNIQKVGPGRALAVLCEEGIPNLCGALIAAGDLDGHGRRSTDSWSLQPLRPPMGPRASLGVGLEALPLPAQWRLATATSAGCSPAPCRAAVLAGWEGHEVVIARAERYGHGSEWLVERSSAVRPGLGCALDGGPQTCHAAQMPGGREHSEGYTHVRGLQLGAAGRTLTVLLDNGIIDGWDLIDGRFLGRWPIGSARNATAMCHDGDRIILASTGSSGRPQLEEGVLPQELHDASVAWRLCFHR